MGYAFSAGVRQGGLNDSSLIRILLCYLIKSVQTPLTHEELIAALLDTELANYFEIANALAELCNTHLIQKQEDHYTLLDAGEDVANQLGYSVPFTVRETAVRAVLAAQQFSRNEAHHKVVLSREEGGVRAMCSVIDRGVVVFSCGILLPDQQSAEFVKARFIENGANISRTMFAALTGDAYSLSALLRELPSVPQAEPAETDEV